MTNKIYVQWRLPSEDYPGRSDDSSLTVEGTKVLAVCNDLQEEYQLSGEPVRDGSGFTSKWPLDPTDRGLVDQLCQKAFGVGLELFNFSSNPRSRPMFAKIDRCDLCRVPEKDKKKSRGTMYIHCEMEHLFVCAECDPWAYAQARGPEGQKNALAFCGRREAHRLAQVLEVEDFLAGLSTEDDVALAQVGNGVWEVVGLLRPPDIYFPNIGGIFKWPRF